MKLIEQRGERIAGYAPALPVYLAGRVHDTNSQMNMEVA